MHPVFGFPYIPASAINGILRSWIINEVFDTDGQNSDKKAFTSRLFCDLFGCEATPDGFYTKENRKGHLIFLDAYPSSGVSIEPDVMTPHYGEYYNTEGVVPPADYLNPNPILFLTVVNTSFVFRIGIKEKYNRRLVDYTGDELATASLSAKLNRRNLTGDDLLNKMALNWLKDALQFSGIGAKTAVGYGRFIKI